MATGRGSPLFCSRRAGGAGAIQIATGGDEAVARASILIAVLGSIGKPALIAVLKETDLAVTWNERKRVRAGGGGKHTYPNIADSEVP